MNYFKAFVIVISLSCINALANDTLQHKTMNLYASEPLIKDYSAIENYKIKADTIQALHGKFNLNIHFATGESTLDEFSLKALSKFADYMNINTKTHIAIVGHTDNVSLLEINQKLSENRAQSVANYLISINVNTNQLKKIAGKNFKEPIGDNATEEGRAINRRVELVLLSQQEAAIAKINWSSKLIDKIDTIKPKIVPETFKKILTQIIERKEKTNDEEIELDGLLVDDTKTKSGKDFYDMFYSNWEAPSKAKNYSIIISEKPFRLTTTIIVITINENLIYQTILQPRQDIIEMQTEEAIAITRDYLSNYEEIMKQLNGDDRSGSGIY